MADIGAWVIKSDLKERVWIGSSSDLQAIMSSKLSVLDSYTNKDRRTLSSVHALPELIREDLFGGGLSIMHAGTYTVSIRREDLREYAEKNNLYNLSGMGASNIENKISSILKAILKFKTYSECELYGGNLDWYLYNEHLIDERNLALIKDLILNGNMKVNKLYSYSYMPKKMQFKVLSKEEALKFLKLDTSNTGIEPVSEIKLETVEFKQQKEVSLETKIIKVEKDIITEKIKHLLKIEAILRGESVEDLINNLISDKAKQIYDTIK